MTWILVFFLLWMVYRMILTLAHAPEQAGKTLSLRLAKPANGHALMPLTDGHDIRPPH